MTLAQDFEEFVKLLNKHQVDYMVVGGYALAFHGKPRHTGDLDIWINSAETNAEKLVIAIKEFGLSSLGLTKSDFMQEGYVTQIGYPPLRAVIYIFQKHSPNSQTSSLLGRVTQPQSPQTLRLTPMNTLHSITNPSIHTMHYS